MRKDSACLFESVIEKKIRETMTSWSWVCLKNKSSPEQNITKQTKNSPGIG